jgi:hypothetical protein
VVRVREPWCEGGTYCAAGGQYLSRYPDLALDVPERYAERCVDIVIDGTVDRGVARIEVDGQPLADLLRDVGRDADADAVDVALASGAAAAAVPVLADVLARLYRRAGSGVAASP